MAAAAADRAAGLERREGEPCLASLPNRLPLPLFPRCCDLDGDGVVRPAEMQYFYEEQLQRMESLCHEPVQFEASRRRCCRRRRLPPLPPPLLLLLLPPLPPPLLLLLLPPPPLLLLLPPDLHCTVHRAFPMQTSNGA